MIPCELDPQMIAQMEIVRERETRISRSVVFKRSYVSRGVGSCNASSLFDRGKYETDRTLADDVRLCPHRASSLKSRLVVDQQTLNSSSIPTGFSRVFVKSHDT